MNRDALCPCGSQAPLGDCCLRFIEGAALPRTPEELMRSRYTAFALGTAGAIDYLVETHHPAFRGDDLKAGIAQSMASIAAWEGLRILESEATGDTGVVEFVATYRQAGQRGELHERSQFVREGGRWFYTEGTVGSGTPRSEA